MPSPQLLDPRLDLQLLDPQMLEFTTKFTTRSTLQDPQLLDQQALGQQFD